MTIDEKLSALAHRCGAPALGPDGVCAACCFARKVTTRIAASDGHVQTTLALCAYRDRLVAPLLELHEVSNPGLRPNDARGAAEADQVEAAFATAPPEERQAFVTLVESLYEQHLRSPA